MKRCAGILALLALVVSTFPAVRAADPAKEIVLSECLVVKSVGRYGRAPLHTDAIEAEIVAGRWKAPQAGDEITLPNGSKQKWEAATAKDGGLDHPALGGGYLYWKVEADEPRVMILEAAGHNMVYANGEPRVGDPYRNGIVRLPIHLRKGQNDFLFHCGRGHLNARLKDEGEAPILDTRDATLPDYRVGVDEQPWAAVVVINPSDKPLQHYRIGASLDKGEPIITELPIVPPCSTRKVGFRVPAAPASAGESVTAHLRLTAKKDGPPLSDATLNLRVRKADQSYKRTFVSEIDGTVQYYAVQPARSDKKEGLALFLTLHGASVEAIGQADAYGGKTWGHIVAPTNRRPYGFDWEDWGRLDAIEVLELAQKELKTDPLRTYLTGHSMGGHGVWHVGATFPDRFAAIAPSAGWVSFWSYAGGRRPEKPTEMEAMLLGAAAPSDTLALARNYAQHGVYVLHGDMDDNVPVGQARTMRKALGEFHPDFVYYERPGAGHWWGNACVDWPPLFEFLQQHALTPIKDVRRVDFITASPGVSARSQWAEIQAQSKHATKPSSVHLRVDPDKRRFSGTTENVGRLALDLAPLKPGEPFDVELDGEKFEKIEWPANGTLLMKRDAGESWNVWKTPNPKWKMPYRYGPFKDAYRNRMIFVYGTQGNKEENAWAFAKARYDAESFWYRGNGAVDIVADVDFDAAKDRDRNVILYGNADSNAAWKALLGESPVQVKRGVVEVGERKVTGDNLACLFLRPKPGSENASVGVVGGSGIVGMRLTDRVPYFVSGCEYPDGIVFGPEVLAKEAEGVRLAGFFGMDWRVESGEFVWGR